MLGREPAENMHALRRLLTAQRTQRGFGFGVVCLGFRVSDTLFRTESDQTLQNPPVLGTQNYMGYPYPYLCLCAFWGPTSVGLGRMENGRRAGPLHGRPPLRLASRGRWWFECAQQVDGFRHP